MNGIVIAGPYDSQDKIAPYNRIVDDCSSHADPNGMYHYHFTPLCLKNSNGNSAGVSPLNQIGWSFDGFKIYGLADRKNTCLLSTIVMDILMMENTIIMLQLIFHFLWDAIKQNPLIQILNRNKERWVKEKKIEAKLYIFFINPSVINIENKTYLPLLIL